MGNTPATLLIGGMFLEEEGGGVWDERKSTVNCGRVRLEWMERTLGKRRASRPPVDVRSTAVVTVALFWFFRWLLFCLLLCA
ncbi:hypothetical protein CEXT_523711 [Caerostris extrusa]|uniref:Transmembrane protein n=1 Tax=Caerostris extrusa TaxID=172846 RepID=A0AAV4NW33_CAEEX|nr:hypothetical protein CEXT_523711 [Caerostris extrusa]